MADETTNEDSTPTTDNAEPTQSIVDMSDSQILDLINKYYALYKQDILDFSNEADFPTDDLINVVAGFAYLEESGELPNAPQIFGDFWKLSWTELQARMGTIPTDNPDSLDSQDTRVAEDSRDEDALVEPADYTDVATGEYNPNPDDENSTDGTEELEDAEPENTQEL